MTSLQQSCHPASQRSPGKKAAIKAIEFRDRRRTEEFRRNGYTVLPQLPAHVLATLRAEHKALSLKNVHQMYSNVHDMPRNVNERIASAISDALSPVVSATILGYEVRGGTFVIKGVGEDSACLVHQDWNAQDESENLALVAWVPLEDVDLANGCLVVAPGTHDVDAFPTLRGANCIGANFELRGELADHCVSLPMRAGEVCLFAQNLFHGSWANQSNEDRVAAYASILPIGAPVIHYLKDDSGTVRRLEIDSSFYYSGEAARWASGQLPTNLADHPTVPDPTGTVQIEDLLAFLQEARPHPETSPKLSVPITELTSQARNPLRAIRSRLMRLIGSHP